ncbi:MAG: carboxypeptidase-like regulatory domain-containing protein [Saprospiraceae bacterium]|nr:carboxypeptidase-like regulatory domain-containing protein [Saprospiraceae bacterium]
MKRLTLTIFSVLLALTSVLAQRTITGTVKEISGEPLIGANVYLKGTTTGTTTDIDGTYTIDVPSESSILVISYIGYNDQEITVGNQQQIDITLSEGITLAETVVTALGISRSQKFSDLFCSTSGRRTT